MEFGDDKLDIIEFGCKFGDIVGTVDNLTSGSGDLFDVDLDYLFGNFSGGNRLDLSCFSIDKDNNLLLYSLNFYN